MLIGHYAVALAARGARVVVNNPKTEGPGPGSGDAVAEAIAERAAEG